MDSTGTIVETMPIIDTDKCFFFKDGIEYLGHAVLAGRPSFSTKAIDVIRGIELSTTVTERKLTLGLCNVFRQFVPNIAHIGPPMSCK